MQRLSKTPDEIAADAIRAAMAKDHTDSTILHDDEEDRRPSSPEGLYSVLTT
jgi:hypothetical protein